ncbi:MAG: hypothetical protein KH354_00550 [Clostridiales bacterium]|nr:hypothetical protein [Clostridiales bacterium]
MSLIKYATFPTARMSVFYMVTGYKDLAVIDFSTNGHGLYHYGHLPRLQPYVPCDIEKRFFSTHLTEVDIALGDTHRLFRAVEEAVNSGYHHVLLMPSSIAAVLGLDLESYAAELSLAFGVNVFTVSVGFHDDFYSGRENILHTLATFFCKTKSPSEQNFYNLLGGSPLWQAKESHRVLSMMLKERLGLDNGFDSLNADRAALWSEAASARLNIITSESAIPAAEYLYKKFGTPYLMFNALGKRAEDAFLEHVANFFDTSYLAEEDTTYDFVLLQMKNILAVNHPKIICYADIDCLSRIKKFFDELDFDITYFCSHQNREYPVLSPDQLIETYLHENVTVISYDRVCRYFSHAVEIDRLGVDFSLQTPLYKPDWGKQGAYLFCENLSAAVFV